jgi:hypothetical protein
VALHQSKRCYAYSKVGIIPYPSSLIFRPRHYGRLLGCCTAGPVTVLIESVGKVLDTCGTLEHDCIFSRHRIPVTNCRNIAFRVDGVVPLAMRINDSKNVGNIQLSRKDEWLDVVYV